MQDNDGDDDQDEDDDEDNDDDEDDEDDANDEDNPYDQEETIKKYTTSYDKWMARDDWNTFEGATARKPAGEATASASASSSGTGTAKTSSPASGPSSRYSGPGLLSPESVGSTMANEGFSALTSPQDSALLKRKGQRTNLSQFQ
jgi:hypothetical protein